MENNKTGKRSKRRTCAASADSAYHHHHHHPNHIRATTVMDPSNDDVVSSSSLLSASLVSSSQSSGFFSNEEGNNDNVGCNILRRKISKRRPPGQGDNDNNNNNMKIKKKDYFHEDDYDTVLARELTELSVEERNKVYEEVHGVAELPHETDSFMQSCLDSLKVEIDKLSRNKRRALDRALFLKPTLTSDTKFMKMFLRADCYDCQKAADRMAKYFQHKLDLWGESKLVKDLTLEDLDEDDMDCMNSGCCHIMREKDRSGRTTMFVSQKHLRFKHWKNHIRYVWYQLMTALEDEETQIRGLVNVLYCVGFEYMENRYPPLLTQGHMLNELPFRIAGFHFCYSDSRFKAALSLVQLVLSQQTRLRFRHHYGSNVEVQYALLSFGIPMHAIPISDDGELKTEMNHLYIQERKSIELMREKMQYQRQDESDISNGDDVVMMMTTNEKGKLLFEYPSPNDVLLGRGRPYQDYRGNQQLMEIVEEQRPKYQSLTDKFEKTCITMTIVSKIKNDLGGRFLQRTTQGWKEVDDFAAREKVSHTFRTKTNKIKMNNMIQSPTQNTMTDAVGSSTNGYGNQNKRIRLHEGMNH